MDDDQWDENFVQQLGEDGEEEEDDMMKRMTFFHKKISSRR